MWAGTILGLLYNQAASLYGPVSRDLRRLDSLSRSPLYATFSEVITGKQHDSETCIVRRVVERGLSRHPGIQTIRAYGASRSMMQRMTKIVSWLPFAVS